MATPLIQIDQDGVSAGTPGQSRSDLVVGTVVSGTDAANVSGTYSWTLVAPPDSLTTAAGTDTPKVTFTPDVEGTYLLFADVTVSSGTFSSYTDDAIGQRVSTQGGAAIKLTNGRRIPGVGETLQFDENNGWATTMTDIFKNDISIKSQGSSVSGGPFITLDFVGDGVTAVDAGSGEATITISGTGFSNVAASSVLLDSHTVTGSDADSVTLTVSGTLPATAKKVWVRCWFNHGEAGTARDFLMLPNGVEGVTDTSYDQTQAGTSTQLNRANTLLFATALDYCYTECFIELEYDKNGNNHYRRIDGGGFANDNPHSAALANFSQFSGFWDNLVDDLNTVEIRSTTQNGPTTLQNSIGVGSYLEARAIDFESEGLAIDDEGLEVVPYATRINFKGAAVTTTTSGGGVVDVTISGTGGGGGGSVAIEDEGSQVTAEASNINFVGDGVFVTDAGGGSVDVTISGTQGTPVGGNWIHIADTSVTSSTDTININGTFDGDADKEYLIDVDLILASGVGNADFRLEPNGLTSTDQESSGVYSISGSSTDFSSSSSWTFAQADVSDRLSGKFIVKPVRRTQGRTFNFDGSFGLVGSNAGIIHSSGRWDEASTNITSWDITSTVGSKILSGSTVSIYKRDIDNIALLSSDLVIKDESITVSSGVTNIDFIGGGVWAEETSPGNVAVTVSGLAVSDDAVTVDSNVFSIDFIGDGVWVQDTGQGSVSVTISGGGAGGGGSISVEDEGSQILASATTLNFAGTGVWAEDAGSGEALITVSGTGPVLLDSQSVTGSDTSTVTLTLGTLPTGYTRVLVKCWIIHGEAGTARDFVAMPNGTEGVLYTANTTVQNGVTTNSHRPNGFMIITALDNIYGEFRLDVNYVRNSTNFYRVFEGFSHANDGTLSRTSANAPRFSGMWDDQTNSLTDIDIVSTVTNTPGTTTNSLGVNSYFELYAIKD